jgi:hypothetical protein
MGNKDKGKREAKKPKKLTPKSAPSKRVESYPVTTIVKE